MGEKTDAIPATSGTDDLRVVDSVGDLSVERTADGDDVAPSRDPDTIAREIEATRAELADAIDAIAERMSPKRAASRGAQAVKAQVASAREKVTGGEGPSSTPEPSGTDSSMPELPAPTSPPASLVAPIAAAVALLAVLAVIIRRRRG